MSDPAETRALADEMKELWHGYSAQTVMSALTLATAEALAGCDMKEGKTIEDAMALFSKQASEIYALLTKDMRS
jgi:hypothetical protein